MYRNIQALRNVCFCVQWTMCQNVIPLIRLDTFMVTTKFSQILKSADLEQSSDISLIMVTEVFETRFSPKLIWLVVQEDFINDMQTGQILDYTHNITLLCIFILSVVNRAIILSSVVIALFFSPILRSRNLLDLSFILYSWSNVFFLWKKKVTSQLSPSIGTNLTHVKWRNITTRYGILWNKKLIRFLFYLVLSYTSSCTLKITSFTTGTTFSQHVTPKLKNGTFLHQSKVQ
jgi:hypothetical protein